MTTGAFSGERWSLSVFSAREEPSRLMDALLAAMDAERDGASLEIDVLINGNRPLAAEMRNRLAAARRWNGGVTARLWSMPAADKALAWNHAVHRLVPDARIAFFMDGYVRVSAVAFTRLAQALRDRRNALAATALPSTGPSAAAVRRRVLAHGGVHGNLYALGGDVVKRLRADNIALPAGLYRNDSALGAALAFNLDPARNAWIGDRIAIVPDAKYETPHANPARLDDLRALARRRLRQAHGTLETAALKAHLADAKRAPSAWPTTSRALVLGWAAEHPADARSLLWTDPLAWVALQRCRRSLPTATDPGPVECLGQYPPVQTLEVRPTAVVTER